MAEGIVKRHSAGCPAKEGKSCRCKAGYEAWVYLPHEKRKVRKTFARKAEAKSWRANALAAVSKRTLHSPSPTTVEQAAWLWLEAALTGGVRDRSGHSYKPGTLREYQRALAQRVLPKFGETRLSELTRAEVQNFVDRLLGEGLSPSTVGNTLNPLQAIYRHAVRRDLVAINPTREVELPADRSRRDRIASAAEAERLLAALPASDRPIWATAFYAGLRRGSCRRYGRAMWTSPPLRSRFSALGINTRGRSRRSRRLAVALCRSSACCAATWRRSRPTPARNFSLAARVGSLSPPRASVSEPNEHGTRRITGSARRPSGITESRSCFDGSRSTSVTIPSRRY